ncbi:MAG: GDSL-type esterase/lipase family protein [Cryobacterium sp.]|nr:GDSL-type esterase/lipase family protein [Cryobacterium sp.]
MMLSRMRIAGMVAVVTLAVAGCESSGSGGGAAPAASASSASRGIAVVAIGDSDTTGIGDSSGRGWVGRYGDLLHQRLGRPVTVENLSAEGKTSDALRNEVAGDDSLRAALSGAKVVLIGIGGADLNAGDDALVARRCKGRACYAPILARFGENISAIAVEVQRLAPSAVLRAMSLPNGFPGAGNAFPPFATAELSRYQVTTEHALVCRAMQRSGGRCVDVVRAFNGPSGNQDAYKSGLMTKQPCCYPSGKGQELIAQLLLATGVKGITSAR